MRADSDLRHFHLCLAPRLHFRSSLAPPSLYASLFPHPFARTIAHVAPPSARTALVQTAMPRSLLLERLLICLRAGTDLLLRCIKTRNHVRAHGQTQARLTGGIGVQVAVAGEVASKPGGEKQQVGEQKGRQPPNHEEERSCPTTERRGREAECSLGDQLARVVARDAAKTQPLLSHVLKHPELSSLPVEISLEQEVVLLARLSVFDALLSELLHMENAPEQLVFFAPGLLACAAERQVLLSPLSIFAVNDAALAVSAAKEGARLHEALPDDVDYVHVDAVLDGCVWDSALVLHGYNWQRRSLWVLQLDVADFEEERLERHFRMIGTLASRDSLVLAVYVTPEFASDVRDAADEEWKGTAPLFSCDDPFGFAKKCGFQVSYATSLRDAAIKYGLPERLRKQLATSVFADGVRFVTFSHTQRNIPPVTHDVDSVSEVTALSGFSATASAASVAAPATPVQFADQSLLGEFEDYVSTVSRVLTFEMHVASLPMDLARPEFSVVLIGSEASFGCWDPKRAKKMYGNICAGAGVMTADMSLGVEACNVEYKYAVTNAQQEIVAWEAGNNRVLSSSSEGGSAVLENVQYVRDEWRCQ